MPVDNETNRATRVKSAVVDGKRVRVGVRSGGEVGGAAGKKAAAGGKKED